jgi:hypothetical protein
VVTMKWPSRYGWQKLNEGRRSWRRKDRKLRNGRRVTTVEGRRGKNNEEGRSHQDKSGKDWDFHMVLGGGSWLLTSVLPHPILHYSDHKNVPFIAAATWLFPLPLLTAHHHLHNLYIHMSNCSWHSSWTAWLLKRGSVCCFKMLVTYCLPVSYSLPNEWRPHELFNFSLWSHCNSGILIKE